MVPDDESGIDQLAQRFPDGRPADAVLLTDLMLGRKARARRKRPSADTLLEEVAEAEVEGQPAPAGPVAPELRGRGGVRLLG